MTAAWRRANVQTDAAALVGRCGTRHRGICGDVGRHSGSGGRNGSLDWIECQQRILTGGQFDPVDRFHRFKAISSNLYWNENVYDTIYSRRRIYSLLLLSS